MSCLFTITVCRFLYQTVNRGLKPVMKV
jgi:hypothetical protein